MRPLRRPDLDQLASLQMENELLVHETRHLRARLSQAEREIRRLTGQEAGGMPISLHTATERALRQAQTRAERQTRLRRRAEREANRAARELGKYRQAHSDLRWLLGRLVHSPVGPVLRRRAGFRTLCDRYGVG